MRYGEMYPLSNWRPSVNSSSRPIVGDSSTVMTPSLPTLLNASAISSPILLSCAEIVATCAISVCSSTSRAILSSRSETSAAAASTPRLRSIGLAPAATERRPWPPIAWARTVAVVVPSPAMSLVLVATSLASWAPRFSYGSSSSTSLATVTPSLVMVGAPHFLSMTTLRPRGPSVTLTVSASLSTPRSSAERASELNSRILGIDYYLTLRFSHKSSRYEHAARAPSRTSAVRAPLAVHSLRRAYFSMTARTSRAESTRYSSPEYLTSVPPYLLYSTMSPTLTSTGTRLEPASSKRPGPTARTSPSWGFSLAVSGITRPDAVVCSASSGRTTIRSSSGLITTLVAVDTIRPLLFASFRFKGRPRPPVVAGARLPRRVSTLYDRVLIRNSIGRVLDRQHGRSARRAQQSGSFALRAHAVTCCY